MHTHPQHVSPRRFRRIETAARALALFASVSLLACEEGGKADKPRGDANEPRPAEPSTPMANREPMKQPEGTAMRPSENEALTQRQGDPGSMRPYDDDPARPTTPGTMPSTSPMDGSAHGGQPSTQEAIEKTATVNMRTFEQRFEDELGEQDLTLAAAFDLQKEPKMRMFVVAPKDLGEPEVGSDVPTPTQGGGMGGAMQPPEGGVMPAPATPPLEGAAGGMIPPPEGGAMQPPAGQAMPGTEAPSAAADKKQAEMALNNARLVVAYADPERPDRVTITYMKSPMEPTTDGEQPDEKLDAAIDAAAGNGMDATPPTGTRQPLPETKTDEERRG